MADAITAQRTALDMLYRRHVAPGQSYALVDFPDHANVGDSAIWLGETRMLRAVTGRAPDYVSTWADFDEAAFRRACPDGVLFLHGGGNLGDIWVHHQAFREDMLRTIRDRPVVQLPQSIHFRDTARIASFAGVVADHPDFHLYVRDRQSLDIAARHLACAIDLAPDSAFALGPQSRPAPADCDVLMLMRTDDERRAEDRSALADMTGGVILDWLDDDTLPDAADTTTAQAHDLAATARVERGLRLLSRGRRIVTDRLHAHILATLLGIPHVALDNDYGKISAYIACWTRDCDGVRTAASAGEAIAQLCPSA
ncbi:polysaccharide pyruvyl transferase family protein [Sphingomonas mollis]|nr:polysaccharide pyruvyl transferase family protein [Sphingomonas sp. BT553]